MGTLWTPPRGFFPWALTYFHPGNIARFHAIFRNDTECDWDLALHKITLFSPACDGGAVGKPVHIWKGDPPSVEDFGTVSSCSNGDYICNDLTLVTTSDCQVTIGQALPAKLHDFWHGTQRGTPVNTAAAIRYGWFFSVRNLFWWTNLGHAMHWMGPAP